MPKWHEPGCCKSLKNLIKSIRFKTILLSHLATVLRAEFTIVTPRLRLKHKIPIKILPANFQRIKLYTRLLKHRLYYRVSVSRAPEKFSLVIPFQMSG